MLLVGEVANRVMCWQKRWNEATYNKTTYYSPHSQLYARKKISVLLAYFTFNGSKTDKGDILEGTFLQERSIELYQIVFLNE